jgi:hypothetical protein
LNRDQGACGGGHFVVRRGEQQRGSRV